MRSVVGPCEKTAQWTRAAHKGGCISSKWVWEARSRPLPLGIGRGTHQTCSPLSEGLCLHPSENTGLSAFGLGEACTSTSGSCPLTPSIAGKRLGWFCDVDWLDQPDAVHHHPSHPSLTSIVRYLLAGGPLTVSCLLHSREQINLRQSRLQSSRASATWLEA